LTCSLSQPIFIASSEVTFIENEDGFFVEAFLISNKLNQNGWMVTAEANKLDGEDFVGKPDIVFYKDGKRDHTTGDTYEKSLEVQEPYRKGTMQKVSGTDTGIKLTTISKITDPDTQEKIRKHEIKFVSPAVFPKSLEDIEIIRTGPDTHIHVLHRYRALHRAFVDEPAYGEIEATVGPTCEGDGHECLLKLQQVSAGIGDQDVEPLREKKIISVKKCSVTGNTIIELENNSLNQQKYNAVKLEDKEKITLLETKLAKLEKDFTAAKANIESDEDKKKAEAAKKAAEEDEKKKLEAKKSAEEKDEEKKKETAKKAAEEDEKKMTARIASEISEKLPLVEKYIAAQTHVASLDQKAQNELRTKMLSASLEDVKAKWEAIAPFAAAMPIKKSNESEIGYYPQQFIASSNLDEMTTEQLLKEAGIEN
jgi:flagellar biosynthesis GTPase FlhF